MNSITENSSLSHFFFTGLQEKDALSVLETFATGRLFWKLKKYSESLRYLFVVHE